MKLIEPGARVTREHGHALGTVAGTYNEEEVLVRWDDLDGLSYEYADTLVLAQTGGQNDELGGGADQQRAG